MIKLFDLEPFCFSFKVEYNSGYSRPFFLLLFFDGDNQEMIQPCMP